MVSNQHYDVFLKFSLFELFKGANSAFKNQHGILVEGEQNIPPQNTPLWHKDYFEPIIFKRAADMVETK